MNKKNLRIEPIDSKLSIRDEAVAALNPDNEEYRSQLAKLSQAMHEKDIHIGNLEQAATLHAREVEALTRTIFEKERLLQQLQICTSELSFRLTHARNSLGWKLFKPMRIIKGIVARFSRRLDAHLVPISDLRLSGFNWLSTDSSPRFLLIAARPWHRSSGWYWLKLNTVADKAINARLQFDLGEGFHSARGVNFLLTGKGLQLIPVFVPPSCRAIRLDADEAPALFRMGVEGLVKAKGDIELCEEFKAQAIAYEALGGRQGNCPTLLPLNDLQWCGDGHYCWRSETEDPYFEFAGFNKKQRAGWFMIELRVRSEASFGRTKIYFDYGAGYSETTAVALPFRNGELARRFYRLSAIPRKIRFDPLEAATKFSVERLNISAVSARFARRKMLKYLFQCRSRQKDKSPQHIWRELKMHGRNTKGGAIDVLYKRYDDSFSAQLSRDIQYSEWISSVEIPGQPVRSAIETMLKSFRDRWTISIVMPTYNTEKVFLQRAIESVLAQSYSHWELCIADDASSEPHVRPLLEEYAQRDPRIKVTFRQQNGHISAASNSALALATGEYIALMDHDDEIAPHALLFVMETINRKPFARILYSDEDKIDEQGNRLNPHFKPEWSPDLFFSQNYVSHLGIYRRELLERINGFRIGVEGSQDHDLMLRCLPLVESNEILHIPRVLYHWRIMEGSTARSSHEKSYTHEAGIKSLRDYFVAQGRDDIEVHGADVPNTYRVRYPLPKPEPLVSLLIPTRDKLELLRSCVQGILKKTTYPNYEIIILDNESIEPETLSFFHQIQVEHSCVRVLHYHNPFNFSAINNYGVKNARGNVIGLINNDVNVINPDWLSEMTSHALRAEIGCVGAKLYYDDNTIQHAGVILGIGGIANHSHKDFPRGHHGYFGRLSVVQNYSAVTAACLLVRKSVYEQVGGLEEQHLKIAFNDVDFCLKVREAGYRNLWTPYAELYHYESKSRGVEDTPEKQARFRSEVEFMQSRWGEALPFDPHYNPNLTQHETNFSIKYVV
jgi:glycosyltransferase involved in cell wall biosynthesis